MNKSIKVTVVFVILLAAFFAVTTSASAGSPVGEEICLNVGGKWDASQNTCHIRTNGWYWEMVQDLYDMYNLDLNVVESICGEVKDASSTDYQWDYYDFGWIKYNGFLFTGCSFSPMSMLDTSVTAGVPVDLYYGNCGISIPNPPLNGTATLTKVRQADPGFVKAACTATYYDFNGTMLPGYGTTATVYVNLDKYSYEQFMQEKIDIFTYNEADGWTACGAAWYELADSDYGRLGCTTADATFGLGRK